MSLSWHRAAYSILRVLVGPFLNHKLNYSCEKVRPKSNPYIVLANHNTDYDPFWWGWLSPIKSTMWQASISSDGD